MAAAPRHIPVLQLALLAGSLAAWGAVTPAEASDFELKPSVTVGEEYSDNIFETADGRKTEFTTRVRPGAVLAYRTPFLLSDAAYSFDYRNYAKKSHADEQIHNVDLKANAELIDNFFYLDVSESLHRATVNVARDLASESLLVEQTTQNLAFVSPYLLWRPTQKGTLKTGYRYADTRYWEGVGFDKREHGAFVDFEEQFGTRTTLYAGYTFTRGDTANVRYDRNDASGGFKYGYADNCFVFGRVGNSWQSFSRGIRTSNLFWDTGITHDFHVVTALLETKVQNTEDPLSVATREVSYTGRLDTPFDRGAVGVSSTYSEYFIVQTGGLEHRRLTVAGTGRYDIRPRLAVSAAVTGDRFSIAADYPYRLTASTGINYGFYNDTTAVSLSYSFLTDRYSLHSAHGEKVTNRVLLELRFGL